MEIDAYKAKIGEVAKKHDLDTVVLFGSQATGRTHAKSDIDIAVSSRAKLNMPRIMLDLDEVFGRDDIEAVDLGKASPTLALAIVKEGKVLYEKEQGSFFRWKIYAIKIWMETAWLRQLRRKQLVGWAAAIS
jgi:predicted nucleotidyltransferase